MPLEGAFVDGDEVFRDATIRGELSVIGSKFVVGSLTVEIGAVRLKTDRVFPDGSLSDVTIQTSGMPNPIGTASLVRVEL
jgi:hypothetical protein